VSNSASAFSATFLNPAKTVNPISSSFLHRYHANGFSHPVTKTALPDAATYVFWRKEEKILF
jgi:hypothetical protein